MDRRGIRIFRNLSGPYSQTGSSYDPGSWQRRPFYNDFHLLSTMIMMKKSALSGPFSKISVYREVISVGERTQ
jgi:hypothetical protein